MWVSVSQWVGEGVCVYVSACESECECVGEAVGVCESVGVWFVCVCAVRGV